jgi:hypothetical protein
MKAFISQPMNGMTDDEIRARREELIRIIKLHCGENTEIIDSFTKSEEIVGKGRIAMLGDSISMMRDADVVLFAKGWQNSAGCNVEHEVCVQYHIRRLFEETMAPPKVSTPKAEYYWGGTSNEK